MENFQVNSEVLFCNRKFVTATATERCFNGSLELLKLLIRHEGERRSGEAAAVDADSTFAAEKLSAMVNAISCFSMHPAGITF